jgi:hypothetical protein
MPASEVSPTDRAQVQSQRFGNSIRELILLGSHFPCFSSELVKGGVQLMPLVEYPFHPAVGLGADRFGVSWQVNLVG